MSHAGDLGQIATNKAHLTPGEQHRRGEEIAEMDPPLEVLRARRGREEGSKEGCGLPRGSSLFQCPLHQHLH